MYAAGNPTEFANHANFYFARVDINDMARVTNQQHSIEQDKKVIIMIQVSSSAVKLFTSLYNERLYHQASSGKEGIVASCSW